MDAVTTMLMAARARQAVEEAKAMRSIPHRGLRGRFREILVGNLVKPFLPPTCSIVHGTVVDVDGQRFLPSVPRADQGAVDESQDVDTTKVKTEDDVLIVDNAILPPFFRSEAEGIVPLDAVLARIEVKSTLTAPELKDAILGAGQFRKLAVSLGKEDLPGSAALRLVFAFASDLKEKSEFTRLKECLSPQNGTEPDLSGLCVAGRGFWFYGKTASDGADGWRVVKASDDHRELRHFVSLLLNTLPTLRAKRQSARFGAYTVALSDIEEAQ